MGTGLSAVENIAPDPERTAVVSVSPAWLCGRPLGEILRETAALTQDKLDEALAKQTEAGGRLGEILVGMKAITEEQLLAALAVQLDVPFLAKIAEDKLDPELVRLVPINFAKQFKVVPLRRGEGGIEVAVADPVDTATLDQLHISLKSRVFPVVVPPSSI